MNYYKLLPSIEEEEIGIYPQAQYNIEYNPGLFTDREMRPHKFATHNPTVELRLEKGAKLTSILSSILSFGFIVNEKVRNILQEYNLPPHRFYSVRITENNNLHSYYWLHVIVDDFFEVVDMKKTILKIQYFTGVYKTSRFLSLDNKEAIFDLQEKLDLDYKLKFHEIHFTDRY